MEDKVCQSSSNLSLSLCLSLSPSSPSSSSSLSLAAIYYAGVLNISCRSPLRDAQKVISCPLQEVCSQILLWKELLVCVIILLSKQ